MSNYRLMGSLTSPYIRRFRLFLAGVPYEFEVIKDIYGADDERLSKINPLKRIPVLMIDGRPLWESRVIYNHLRSALSRPVLDLDEENALSAVDALQDLLVQNFLMAKYNHPVLAENEYFKRHADRRIRTLVYLQDEVRKGRFERWDYPSISLFCLLDWATFRSQLTADEVRGPLESILAAGQGRLMVKETDPRRV